MQPPVKRGDDIIPFWLSPIYGIFCSQVYDWVVGCASGRCASGRRGLRWRSRLRGLPFASEQILAAATGDYNHNPCKTDLGKFFGGLGRLQGILGESGGGPWEPEGLVDGTEGRILHRVALDEGARGPGRFWHRFKMAQGGDTYGGEASSSLLQVYPKSLSRPQVCPNSSESAPAIILRGSQHFAGRARFLYYFNMRRVALEAALLREIHTTL